MRPVVSALLLAAVMSFGCRGSPNGPSGALPVTTTVQVGERTTVAGLSLTFVGVSADSRCPIDAICVTAGDATLRFVLSANQRASSYDVQVERPDKRRATHEGFTIEVQRLEPYPWSGRPLRQDEYRSTVMISR